MKPLNIIVRKLNSFNRKVNVLFLIIVLGATSNNMLGHSDGNSQLKKSDITARTQTKPITHQASQYPADGNGIGYAVYKGTSQANFDNKVIEGYFLNKVFGPTGVKAKIFIQEGIAKNGKYRAYMQKMNVWGLMNKVDLQKNMPNIIEVQQELDKRNGIFESKSFAMAEVHSYNHKMAIGIILGPPSMIAEMRKDAKELYASFKNVDDPLDDFAVFIVESNGVSSVTSHMTNLGDPLKVGGRQTFSSATLKAYASKLTVQFKKELWEFDQRDGIFEGKGLLYAEKHSHRHKMANGIILGPPAMISEMRKQAKALYDSFKSVDDPLDDFAVFIVEWTGADQITSHMTNLGKPLTVGGKQAFSGSTLKAYASKLTAKFKEEQKASRK